MKQIVLATKNKNKIRECNAELSRLGLEAVAVTSVIECEEPEENGMTFMENALIKARYYAEKSGMAVIADDSGLVVDCLDGAPGIYSARYAGDHGDDGKNNEKLVAEVLKTGASDRSAAYVCAMAYVSPDGTIFTAEGRCEGEIITEARGTDGFGYDPFFYVPAFERTMAELTMDEKNAISHRGKALRELVNILEAGLDEENRNSK